MPWARLDDKFHGHPSTWQAGLEANGLFARALSYCADHLTDGFLPEEWLYAQVPSTRKCRDAHGLIQKLLDVGILEPLDNGFFIRDYLAYNPSREQVEAERLERSDQGKRGAKARWNGSTPEQRSDAARHAARARWGR